MSAPLLTTTRTLGRAGSSGGFLPAIAKPYLTISPFEDAVVVEADAVFSLLLEILGAGHVADYLESSGGGAGLVARDAVKAITFEIFRSPVGSELWRRRALSAWVGDEWTAERGAQALAGWQVCGVLRFDDRTLTGLPPLTTRWADHVVIARSGFGVSVWRPGVWHAATFSSLGELVRLILTAPDRQRFGDLSAATTGAGTFFEAGLAEILASWVPSWSPHDWATVLAAPPQDRPNLCAGALKVLDLVGALPQDEYPAHANPAVLPIVAARLPTRERRCHLVDRYLRDQYAAWVASASTNRSGKRSATGSAGPGEALPPGWERYVTDEAAAMTLVRVRGVGWVVLDGDGAPLHGLAAPTLGDLTLLVDDAMTRGGTFLGREMFAPMRGHLSAAMAQVLPDTETTRAVLMLNGLGSDAIPPDAFGY